MYMIVKCPEHLLNSRSRSVAYSVLKEKVASRKYCSKTVTRVQVPLSGLEISSDSGIPLLPSSFGGRFAASGLEIPARNVTL